MPTPVKFGVGSEVKASLSRVLVPEKAKDLYGDGWLDVLVPGVVTRIVQRSREVQFSLKDGSTALTQLSVKCLADKDSTTPGIPNRLRRRSKDVDNEVNSDDSDDSKDSEDDGDTKKNTDKKKAPKSKAAPKKKAAAATTSASSDAKSKKTTKKSPGKDSNNTKDNDKDEATPSKAVTRNASGASKKPATRNKEKVVTTTSNKKTTPAAAKKATTTASKTATASKKAEAARKAATTGAKKAPAKKGRTALVKDKKNPELEDSVSEAETYDGMDSSVGSSSSDEEDTKKIVGANKDQRSNAKVSKKSTPKSPAKSPSKGSKTTSGARTPTKRRKLVESSGDEKDTSDDEERPTPIKKLRQKADNESDSHNESDTTVDQDNKRALSKKATTKRLSHGIAKAHSKKSATSSTPTAKFGGKSASSSRKKNRRRLKRDEVSSDDESEDSDTEMKERARASSSEEESSSEESSSEEETSSEEESDDDRKNSAAASMNWQKRMNSRIRFKESLQWSYIKERKTDTRATSSLQSREPQMRWMDDTGANYDRPPLAYFMEFFIGPEGLQELVRCTNQRLARKRHPELSVHEFEIYVGLILAMTHSPYVPRKFLWSANSGDSFVSPNFSRFMAIERFKQISAALCFVDENAVAAANGSLASDMNGKSSHHHHELSFAASVEPLVQWFNSRREATLNPGHGMCCDEVLAKWERDDSRFEDSKKILRKAIGDFESLGVEIFSLSCCSSYVTTRIELVDTQEGMPMKKFDEGRQPSTALMMRLAEPLAGSGRTIYATPLLASVEAAVYLRRNLGLFMIGSIKGNDEHYPRDFLKGYRYKHRGDSCFLETDIAKVPIFAHGWKGSHVECIVANCGTALPGEKTKKRKRKSSSYIDKLGNEDRKLPKDMTTAEFFSHASVADIQSYHRSEILKMEQVNVSKRFETRLFTSILGICITDAYFASSFFCPKHGQYNAKNLHEFVMAVSDGLLSKDSRGKTSS